MTYHPNITIGKDREEVADLAAQWFIRETDKIISKKGKASIIVPTGSSPKRFYELLADRYKYAVQWKNIHAYSLDELVGIPDGHPMLFRTYMDDILFSKVPISKEQIVFLNSNADDFELESIKFEKKLLQAGGGDICILGVGSDGHIGMNFPNTPFSSQTRKITLPEDMRPKPDESNVSEVIPTSGITIGIKTILTSKSILLLVDGESKMEAIEHLFAGTIQEEWPITSLQNHADVQVFAAENACSKKVITSIKK